MDATVRLRRSSVRRFGGAGGQHACAVARHLGLFDHVMASDGRTNLRHAMVSDALERLEEHDAESAQVVKLRFFAGFTLAQAADIIGVSERTAKRMWAYARAWLYDFMEPGNKQ